MKKTLLICATALFVASCSKDTTETSEVPEAKPQGIIFSAAQDNDTRTKLDGVNILWQRGDAVGISSPEITEAVNYKAVIAEEDHDKQYATLHTDLNYSGNHEHTFFAYYPYADEQSEVAMVHGSISTLQNGDIGSNAFMWATATVDPATMPRVDLHFKHPFTYLNIQLRATSEYYGATVERIRIEVPEGKTLAGEFFADFISDMVFFTTNERAVEVDLTSQEDRPAAVLGDDYLNTLMVVNAEDLTDSELTVIVTLRQNGNVVKLRTVKTGRRLNPQTKVNLKLTVEEMEAEQSDDVIMFADDAVESICVERWDTNGDGRLSYKEAAEVRSLDWAFGGNADISSFDELQYFKGLTSIDNTFYGCSSLTSIVIPNNVMSIEGTFSGCSNLANITLPNNLTSIGRGTFESCSSLESIVIPDNVTLIEDMAFYGCSSLTSIVIPDNVTTLGGEVFDGCVKLTDITIGNGIKTIPEYCFSGCSMANIVIPENVTLIGNGAFSSCTSLENIVIPENVKSIGDHAFQGCNSLTSIVIPDNVTSIGPLAFHRCVSLKTFNGKNASEDHRCLILNGELIAFAPASLKEYTIPEGVTSIGSLVFTDCTKLENITIPDSVTEIKERAFECCDRMTSVTIPQNVTTIEDYAFSHCPLTDVYCRALTPPSCGFRAFSKVTNLYVPTESVNSYSTAAGWSEDFFNIIGYNFGTL